MVSQSLTHYGTVVIFFHEEMNTRETNLADGMTSFFLKRLSVVVKMTAQHTKDLE